MKDTTLQTLITARSLLDHAEKQCAIGDRYLATAGLIVLQDAFELILYAVLNEKGFNDSKKMDRFDDMLAEVIKLGIEVPKSHTLKAMNKLRVTAKHYGQIMEPLTVQGHLDAVKTATDAVLIAVVGKPLREILLTELVGDIPARQFLDEAALALNCKNYLAALVATRKAFYLEFEREYCVYRFREGVRNFSNLVPGSEGYLTTGTGCQNPAWIEAHVRQPLEYVQINRDTWRFNAMEWGINTQILDNIRHLTPNVVQLDDYWYVEQVLGYSVEHYANVAPIVLDLTIEAIRRKREHFRLSRRGEAQANYVLPKEYVGQGILDQIKQPNHSRYIIREDSIVVVEKELLGFNQDETFYYVRCAVDFGLLCFGYVKKIAGSNLVPVEPK